MLKLCASIQSKRVPFDRDADLTLPNVYFCTVVTHDNRTMHTYLAADHTKVVMQKVSNWCVDHHSFRPYRSNSTIKVRRMKLGDIIENPNSYCQALAHAKNQCEADIVRELRKWPQMISSITGVPLPVLDSEQAASLWDALSEEVSRQMRA